MHMKLSVPNAVHEKWVRSAVQRRKLSYNSYSGVYDKDWPECCDHVPSAWRHRVLKMVEAWSEVNRILEG